MKLSNPLVSKDYSCKALVCTGEDYFNASQVAKSHNKKIQDFLRLESTQVLISDLLRQYPNYTYEDLVQVKHGGKNPGTTLHKLLQPEVQRWVSKYPRVNFTRSETVFQSMLQSFLDGYISIFPQSGYTLIPQFLIGSYRVDFYLKELNLVIEYDEPHHAYKKELDIQRELEIRNIIKCNFLRVNKDEEIQGLGKLASVLSMFSIQQHLLSS